MGFDTILIALAVTLNVFGAFIQLTSRKRWQDEGVREAGALMRKCCEAYPEGSYAREAYEFVLGDLEKAAK